MNRSVTTRGTAGLHHLRHRAPSPPTDHKASTAAKRRPKLPVELVWTEERWRELLGPMPPPDKGTELSPLSSWKRPRQLLRAVTSLDAMLAEAEEAEDEEEAVDWAAVKEQRGAGGALLGKDGKPSMLKREKTQLEGLMVQGSIGKS